MELGMFTSGYQRYPLERAFSDAGRLGYDYIELWGGRPHAFAPDLRLGGVAEIRSMVEKYQMPVYVYTPEHNAYPYNYMAGGRAQWEDSMEYLELCLEMGKALGAEYTLISVGHGGYSVPRRALWARLVESLRRLADRAEALDHKILLESLTPWESNLCTTAGELAQALEEVDSPCLLGMCDVVPPAAAGEPVENYLDALSESFIFYRAGRYDIKGRQYLKTGSKYYAADIGLRYSVLGTKKSDAGHILENIVYLELLRRGYEVHVGKVGTAEVDYIAIGEEGEEYYQVAYTVIDADGKTLERELAPLDAISDHNPKYLLTMDYGPMVSHNGIRQIYVLDWLMK